MILPIIAWIEFYALISKIVLDKKSKGQFLRFLYKSISLIYFFSLAYFLIIVDFKYDNLKIFIVYSLLVSVMSDVGGLICGRIFKGKKLTKISPKKTISGSIGSFAFSLFLIPFFKKDFYSYDFIMLIMITLLISLTTQLGDLFISYLKRKANVKDTSDLLPGHGGVLDRIDGIIFALPVGVLLFNNF